MKMQLFPGISHVSRTSSEQGVQSSRKKIEAILTQTNFTELRSFLGMVNHYGKYIKFLADLSAPLNHLLEKGYTMELVE